MNETERNDLFKQLCEEGATCMEIAIRTGFIRIDEEGEEKCECKTCQMEFEI